MDSLTVYDRQLDVHQDEIGSLFCYGGERLLTVLNFDDLMVGSSQHIADDLAIIWLVLDHQNALAHAASTCRSTTTGSVNANVEP